LLAQAATNISVESRRDAPAIPWQAIVTMRNRLIHGYFDVDRDGKDHTEEDWVTRSAR